MDCSSLLQSLSVAIEEGWHCQQLADDRLLLAPPFTYPDGDHPELLVTMADGGVIVISDFGSVTARLSMSDVSFVAGRVRASLRAIAAGYGVRFEEDGDLRLDVVVRQSFAGVRDSTFGQAILRMSAAMLQIDALRALEVAPREPQFSSALTRFLMDDPRLAVAPRFRVSGKTDKRYRVTAAVGTDPNSLVFVQGIARATSTDLRNIDHTFRTFSDVNGIVVSERKISVLADHPDNYDPSDVKLLKQVSLVATWAQRDRLVSYLVAPHPVVDNELYDENEPGLFALS